MISKWLQSQNIAILTRFHFEIWNHFEIKEWNQFGWNHFDFNANRLQFSQLWYVHMYIAENDRITILSALKLFFKKQLQVATSTNTRWVILIHTHHVWSKMVASDGCCWVLEILHTHWFDDVVSVRSKQKYFWVLGCTWSIRSTSFKCALIPSTVKA